MKAQYLVLLPVLFALCLLPRIGSSAEPVLDPREPVDNAAVSPPGAEPAAPSASPLHSLPPPPVPPAPDNAAVPPSGAEPATPAATQTPSLPQPTVPPAPDNAAIPPHRAEPVAPAADNAVGLDNTWIDRSHRFVEMCLFSAADWCDRLLGTDALPVAEPTTASVWWKNDFRYDGLQHYTFRTAFRASVRLPRLANRWHLVIAGENQGDPTAAIPVDPGTPGANVASTVRAASAGLVYDLFRTERTFFNIGAGVQVKNPPDGYARVRFQFAQPLGSVTVGRFTTTGAYHAREGAGVSNQLDFERRLSPRTTMLWANSATLSEESNGWEWGSELSVLHALSGTRSTSFGGSVRGDTRPSAEVRNYRVYAGYRMSVLRPWLFCELVPDLNWPLRDDGSRDLVWGATFRFEVFFLGKDTTKGIPLPPPPPPPPPTSPLPDGIGPG